MTTNPRSRLARIEEKNNLRRAYLLIIITLGLVIGLLVFGVPLLIKAATFLGELRSGNEIVQNKDKIPPQIPFIEPYAPYINTKSLDLYGKTEPGVAIISSVNGNLLEQIVTDAEGTFVLSVPLKEGSNNIEITAKDTAGNESEPKTIVITFDDQPPILEITSPASLSSKTEESRLSIIGKSEPGAQVYLDGRRLIVDREGNFQSTVTLQEGENTLSVLAKDLAQNETIIQLTIRYERF